MSERFTNLPGADELDVPPPLTPGEKITVRRTLSLNWDGDVDPRGRKLAEARGYAAECFP